MATVQVHTAERTAEIEANTVVSGSIDGSGHLILEKHDGSTVDAGSVVGSVSDASETTKGLIELATDAETIAGTDAVRAVTPLALAALTAADTRRGLVELATNAEVTTGTDTARAVTPAGLAQLVATATIKGLVELATDAETATGTDATRAVTPASLASLVASLTAKGIVELATTAETTTGTDATRAVTPAGVQAVRDLLQPIDSDLTAIAALTPANDDVIQRKSGVWTNRTATQLMADLAALGEFPNILTYSGSAYVDTDSVNIYIGSVDPGSVANGSIWFDTTA
jgi:hypothetical protein